ncbi:DUF58 domain-containing protein [Terriglobus sp. 2YAB30_2]|uniref:DUF58 domain-containing protein n=1 Tax=unclassified Terriglobus TaxID=2628988 RepID=UPI003F9A2814
MQTLIPEPVAASATLKSQRWRLFAFALTPRALWLLTAGVLFAIPAFFLSHTLWMMPVWDGIILVLAAIDAWRLPKAGIFTVRRRFVHAPMLGERTDIVLEIEQAGSGRMRVAVMDGLHPALSLVPPLQAITIFRNQLAEIRVPTFPAKRGEMKLDHVYLRYRSILGLAEGRSLVPLEQTIRVVPQAVGTADDVFLIRARQIELEKRRRGRIGLGREFESLRDYQQGDELRNISWTATARRGKPITRTFRTERSQQVWTVIDAGRLSRTSFELKVGGSNHGNSAMVGFQERAHDDRLHLQQVDQAVSAAMRLSQVVDRAGDRSALLAYGRRIQQQISPSKGAPHLRRMLDALSMVHSEHAEADHRLAAARFRQLQTQRSLVFWITEMAESASAPDVSLAVADLAKRHLVVLVLLEHPELTEFARQQPRNATEMFAVTAANEMLARRRLIVAQLQRRGVLVVETSPEKAGIAAINRYLEIKSQGTL